MNSVTTNFVVNYEGRSELVKVSSDINFQLFWRMIMNLYQLESNSDMFLYAVPNDFSYPIFLTEHIYNTLQKATSKVGVNNVIHLRILTPLSFIFEVNPTHFTSSQQQGTIDSKHAQHSISRPKYKPITADVEGFYFDDNSEAMVSESAEGQDDFQDPRSFIKAYESPEGVSAKITLNPGVSTFELKDNKNNFSYAARIQIKNTGNKKLIAMNWSLRQILASRGTLRTYPLPDLEPGETYDLIFNLNLKEGLKEVTHWCLCVLNNEGEEKYFSDLLKAVLKDKHPHMTLIEQARVAEYVSGICPL